MTTTMTMTDRLTEELTKEALTTRRVLDRVPEDKLSWKPHPKSMSLGQLALHLVQVPGGVAEFLKEREREVPDFSNRPQPTSLREIVSTHDESVHGAKAQLATWSDDDLAAEWTMKAGDETILAVPRMDMVRSVMFNHVYHHRGELLVYLRMLDVPVPSVYGPTADENPFVTA